MYPSSRWGADLTSEWRYVNAIVRKELVRQDKIAETIFGKYNQP